MKKPNARERILAAKREAELRAALNAKFDELHDAYKAGDSRALLRALDLAARLTAPWAARALREALERFDRSEDRTLLNIKRPRKNSAARKFGRTLAPVLFALDEAQRGGRPLNDATFAEIGRRFGISKTEAWELWRGEQQARARVQARARLAARNSSR